MLDVTRPPLSFRLLRLWDQVRVHLRRERVTDSFVDLLPDFYEEVWTGAAKALGATLYPLRRDAFEIARDAVRTRIYGTATALDNPATHRIVRYKAVAYQLLRRHGLPTPRHASFQLNNMRPAVDFLNQSGAPCVVKPADGAGGGRGITTGVRSRGQLARAACAAAAHGTDLLIEQQIEGDSYRLLYLDGKLLDAVLRRPPSIKGDGCSTISQLIQTANAARASTGSGVAHGPLTVDLEMQWVLASQGYTLRSVPRAGSIVQLKRVTNESSGMETLPAASALCPALVEQGAKAAAALGVRLAGVDILIGSPRVSLHESGGVVLEVSTCPGLFWHYHRQGAPAPVCIPILRCLLEEAV